MAIYTVHMPPLDGKRGDPADRMLFIRDGFSLAACLLTPLWLLVRRQWLALAGWIAVSVLIEIAGLHFGSAVATALGLVFALWCGTEARNIRRWTLGRRGWLEVGVVEATGLEAAERRFFATWLRGSRPWAAGREIAS